MKQRKKITEEAALYECAVRALARRMRSVAEVKRLLRQRVEAEGGEALIEGTRRERVGSGGVRLGGVDDAEHDYS